MSYGSHDDFDTAVMRGRDYPAIRQFSIFCPNKIGQLMKLMRTLETSDLRIIALTVVDSVECAIIRLMVTQPDRAYEILDHSGYRFAEVDMVVVEVPNDDFPLMRVCLALLKAEVNIHYTYPVLMRPTDRPAIAFHVDNIDTGIRTLEAAGFNVLSENSLEGM